MSFPTELLLYSIVIFYRQIKVHYLFSNVDFFERSLCATHFSPSVPGLELTAGWVVKYLVFLMAQTVMNPLANAGDQNLIPGLGRSPGEKVMVTRSIILPWRIPWTEEPGGLQSMRSPRVRYD